MIPWKCFFTTLLYIFVAVSSQSQDDPPTTCPIPLISNGLVIGNDNKNLLVGDELTVKCGANYEPSRTSKSVCTISGLVTCC